MKAKKTSSVHLGSSFNEFLKKELKNSQFCEEFKQARHQLALGFKAREILKKKGFSLRELAKKMGTSLSQVTRLLNDQNISLDTLARFAKATDSTLYLELR